MVIHNKLNKNKFTIKDKSGKKQIYRASLYVDEWLMKRNIIY